MILTEANYQELWVKDFGMPLHTIPSYHQYLQREVYQQDYLDLFIGKVTFQRKVVLGTKECGVPLEKFEGLLNLSSISSPYVKVIDKEQCLLVDYIFPYDDDDFKKVAKREIEFVLIGEAAPPSTAPLEENFYFYNKMHRGSTPYFNAPAKAFGEKCNKKHREKKEKILVNLASKGVVLFDLFPFNISYSDSLRKVKMITDRCSKIFAEIFKKHPSVKFSFICSIINAEDLIKNNTALLGGETKAHWSGWTTSAILFKHSSLDLIAYNSKGKEIGNWHKLKIPVLKFTFIYKYKAYGKSNSGYPHEIPIRFAFNL